MRFMADYLRNWVAGGTYFFTVNLLHRGENDLLVKQVDLLRLAVKKNKEKPPFSIDAWLVLPEHLHAVMTLPPGDHAYDRRWASIKALFSKSLPKGENVSASRLRKGERGIWQRRFLEHTIRDEVDLVKHIDYVHNNPVKHGYVEEAKDWPYSTIHRVGPTLPHPVPRVSKKRPIDPILQELNDVKAQLNKDAGYSVDRILERARQSGLRAAAEAALTATGQQQ
jgi:putative transposase